MTSQCIRCDRFVQGTSIDPVISAKSLGWKNYHYACAKLEWSRLAPGSNDLDGQAQEAEEPAVEKKTRFYVQSVMITNGVEESRWHTTLDTLEAAEDYCEKQMAPSDFSKAWASFDVDAAIDGTDSKGVDPDVLRNNFIHVECNVTEKKYVNCTISLLMKTGKKTVIDERVNILAQNNNEESDAID